ncbi:MAG TPA: hypothetical protein VFE62_17350, partial [Gemmataceae bacterium]|nr:hypothetical protein [Gemmataceae bacterium]
MLHTDASVHAPLATVRTMSAAKETLADEKNTGKNIKISKQVHRVSSRERWQTKNRGISSLLSFNVVDHARAS